MMPGVPPMLQPESLHSPFLTLSQEWLADNRQLLEIVRGLHRRHGIQALATPFLEKQPDRLYHRLLGAGFKQPVLLAALGLTGEYAAWKEAHRSYRGDVKPKWNWQTAIARATAIVAEMGDLPTVEWFRKNGLSALTTVVHRSGRTWEDLRTELGLPPTRKFCESKNGMRWLSQPEALFSDYLHERGIEHRRGERYPADYAKKTNKKWARYDVHFRAANGKWIDVEIWGETKESQTLSGISRGRYRRSKAVKEKWHKGRRSFLGVSYKDCYSCKRLTEILQPYIGNGPVNSKATPAIVPEKSLYRDKDELLAECRKLAAAMPDGIFPTDSWLRKRGKHKNRLGPTYNSFAIYVFRWLGGTRRVRELLGQGSASTTKWDAAKVRTEWAAFLTKTGLTPSQVKGKNRIAEMPREIVNEAGRIYRVAHDLGLLASLRGGHTARKIIWTPEYTLEQWRTFETRTGRSPLRYLGEARRKPLPKDITAQAIRIYDAARRTGVLAQARRPHTNGSPAK